MSGYVYYILCTETERVKIGFTSGRVEVRLKALQTGAPAPLEILAYHEGSPELERKAHALFADHRVCGEWFTMSPELFQLIVYTIVWTAKNLWKSGKPFPEWVMQGLAGLADDEGEIRDELKAMFK